MIDVGLYRKPDGPGRTYTFKLQVHSQTVGLMRCTNSRLSLVLIAAQEKTVSQRAFRGLIRSDYCVARSGILRGRRVRTCSAADPGHQNTSSMPIGSRREKEPVYVQGVQEIS